MVERERRQMKNRPNNSVILLQSHTWQKTSVGLLCSEWLSLFYLAGGGEGMKKGEIQRHPGWGLVGGESSDEVIPTISLEPQQVYFVQHRQES